MRKVRGPALARRTNSSPTALAAVFSTIWYGTRIPPPASGSHSPASVCMYMGLSERMPTMSYSAFSSLSTVTLTGVSCSRSQKSMIAPTVCGFCMIPTLNSRERSVPVKEVRVLSMEALCA